MGSVSRGRALFTVGGAHQNIVCGRAHQIGALALIAFTFLLTRAIDRLYYFPTPSSSSLSAISGESPASTPFHRSGTLSWPHRGYGASLSLKIYVYEESEVDGLRELMRGRDGKISVESCAKGQWGTQSLGKRHSSTRKDFYFGSFACNALEIREVFVVSLLDLDPRRLMMSTDRIW